MALLEALSRVRIAMAERHTAPARPTLVGRSWTSFFAAAQPSQRGRTIRGLAAHGDQVYVGYGDRGSSAGPIHVHAIDTRTGQLSGSLLVIAGAQNTHMQVIDGALHVANLAPHGRRWRGVSPFASNRSGAWSMSSGTNCRRVLGLEAVPGLPGAVMALGLLADDVGGVPGYATWLTMDGGSSWIAFRALGALEPIGSDPFGRLMWVGSELYVVFRGSAWRWRNVAPPRHENLWSAGWERVVLPEDCNVMAMAGARTGGNGTFAAWSKGPTWTFDGRTVRQMFGHLDFGMAFATDVDDGHVYAVTRAGGVVRSLDGVRWFRHPSSGVWGRSGIPAYSIAVTRGTIFVGDDAARIHAVASTGVNWLPADTLA